MTLFICSAHFLVHGLPVYDACRTHAIPTRKWIGVLHHRTKLLERKNPAMLHDPLLTKEDGPTRVEFGEKALGLKIWRTGQ